MRAEVTQMARLVGRTRSRGIAWLLLALVMIAALALLSGLLIHVPG